MSAYKVPTQQQIDAGFHRGRQVLDEYSRIDSAMVNDEALLIFVKAIAEAVLNSAPTPTENRL